MGHSPKHPHPINTQQKEETHLRRHGDCVQQWFTDGDITVICHRRQDVGFRKDKEAEKKKLSHTPCIGNGISL